MKVPFRRWLALDLGTDTTRIAVQDKGLVLREPTLAAVDRRTGEVVRVGLAAQDSLGRTPGDLVAVRPLADGVIQDLTVAASLLGTFLKQVPGRGRSSLVMAVPSGASQVARKAAESMALEAGVRWVKLVDAPLAAALGAGLEVNGPEGVMVADLGAGCVDAALLSLGGVVAARCLPLGGDALDESLMEAVRQHHRVLLGRRTARDAKELVGAVSARDRQAQLTVKGRCLDTGLPKAVTLTAEHTAEAFAPLVKKIAASLQGLLEEAPPELAADVRKGGLLLTGGGCRLAGLTRYLEEALEVPVRAAEEPESCVILGLEKLPLSV